MLTRRINSGVSVVRNASPGNNSDNTACCRVYPAYQNLAGPFFLLRNETGNFCAAEEQRKIVTDGWTRRLAEERVGGAKIPSVGEPCGDHAWTVLGGRRKRESR